MVVESPDVTPELLLTTLNPNDHNRGVIQVAAALLAQDPTNSEVTHLFYALFGTGKFNREHFMQRDTLGLNACDLLSMAGLAELNSTLTEAGFCVYN